MSQFAAALLIRPFKPSVHNKKRKGDNGSPCRVALNPSFHSIIYDLAQSHRPPIMILTETKVSGSRANDIFDKLPFDEAFHVNKFGFSGGIWVLWDSTQAELSFHFTTE